MCDGAYWLLNKNEKEIKRSNARWQRKRPNMISGSKGSLSKDNRH